ncbi:MAG: type I phosphomannose isomerase catalytic subunit [Succinivibrio dextrinosolvens]|nr:type I phosphomannose isomerase catalytic subunit [Succinivibrio dextrinosolvens]
MKNKPFLLKPAAKDYLWGGTRLNDDFGKNINLKPLAETWECSTHKDGPSIVADTGEALNSVLKKHPEYLGTHALSATDGRAELPILVKLIDAKSDLSVQVHPDDNYAKKIENSLGKTEMWYVIDSRADSELVYGFSQDVTKDLVKDSATDGFILKYLNHVKVNKGDLFFIEPGTVHAIGAGCLIAEIQESSNITYRLYDYDRVDKNGNKRELHLDKALDVVNLKSSASPRQPMRVYRYQSGCAHELLCRCRYFQVERIILNTENRKLAVYKTFSNSFHSLLCVDGCGVLFGDGIMIPFFKGDCIFVPADSIPLKLHGKAQLLDISC